MAMRRVEDIAACAVVGAEVVHLPLLEAPHHGYETAAALVRPRLAGDDAVEALLSLLGPHVAAADLVLGPLAIGNHVEHHVVRDALAALRPDALMWEDWSYADRDEAGRNDPVWRLPLDSALVKARIAACACYRSQLGFQFGSADAMAARLSAQKEERFYDAL